MESVSALMAFLLALTSCCPCSGQENIFASKFLKTSVIIENAGVGMEPTFTNPVKKIQECSQLCTGDYGCRKYMVTTDITTQDKLCYRYSDGEHCVATESEVLNKESVCYRKLKQSNGTHCVSPVGYYGPNCEHIITDCNDGKNNNFKNISLSYVKPADKIFEVLCNFEYGVTTIQVRRWDAVEVNFIRPWSEYVNGFGNTHSEYWVGLQNIYDLTNNDNVLFDLNIDINYICYIKYSKFKLLDTNEFRVDLYSTTYNCSINGMIDFEGAQFLTYDACYNNQYCQLPNQGGWWYNQSPCTFMNLNNPRVEIQNGNINYVLIRLVPEI